MAFNKYDIAICAVSLRYLESILSTLTLREYFPFLVRRGTHVCCAFEARDIITSNCAMGGPYCVPLERGVTRIQPSQTEACGTDRSSGSDCGHTEACNAILFPRSRLGTLGRLGRYNSPPGEVITSKEMCKKTNSKKRWDLNVDIKTKHKLKVL